MEQLRKLSNQVCAIARQAGEKVMPYYQDKVRVTWKRDASPLTEADTASHDFLVGCLCSLTPEIPVISEESDHLSSDGIAAAKRFWMVDPLDGTKEFLKGTNEFTINVALVDEGRPILGVIHAPAIDLTYYGLQNSGAWREVSNEPPVPISCRRADSSRLSVVASKDHAGPLVGALLDRLQSPQLQSMGSSLKFCLVAEGKADVYLRDVPTMEWDTAAAQCIVEAAGGGVYTLNGGPLLYRKPGLKNPAIITIGDVQFDWLALIS